MTIALPSHLTDDALLGEVQRLANAARQATAQLVAHLAVLDERRLFLRAGFPSLFAYCLGALHLAEHATYNRIEAARAARVFPVVLDRLADGSVTLTTVRLLAPHLTAANHEMLLREATHRTKEQVLELIARIAPRPDVAPSIRKLPVHTMAPATVPHPPAMAPAAIFAAPPAPTARPAVVAPLAPDRYEIRFTASAATRQKLKHAQDLLRHAVPSGDPAEVIDRALTVLIDTLQRRQHAATTKPRRLRLTGRHSRHIPAEVRRAVKARDDGRCAFVGDGGRRCEATGRMQYHHVQPYQAQGPATVENIQLRCAAHNRYESELYFGPINASRGANRVGEGSARYALSPRRSTRSGTSCVAPRP